MKNQFSFLNLISENKNLYNSPCKHLQEYFLKNIYPKVKPQIKIATLNLFKAKFSSKVRSSFEFDDNGFFNGTIDLIDDKKKVYLAEVCHHINFKTTTRYFGDYVTCSAYVLFNLQGFAKVSNISISYVNEHEY